MSKPLELESLYADLLNPGERTLSPDGSTWLFTLPVGGATQLFTMPVDGGFPRQITSGLKGFAHPAWSPDGKRICADSRGGIFVLDADGSNVTELTRHPIGDSWANWFPDGKRIMFGSKRRGWTQAYVIPVDKSAPARCITSLPMEFKNSRISPDGTRVAAFGQNREDVRRIEVWIFPVDTQSDPVCVTPPGDYREYMHEWCADGQTLLLLSEGPGDDFMRLVRVDVSDPHRKRSALTSGPREDGRATVSKTSSLFAFTRETEGVSELWSGDSRTGTCARIETPPGGIDPLAFSPDNRSLYVSRNSPTEIPHLARIDLASGRMSVLSPTQPPGYSASDFLTPQRIHFKTRAGFTVGAHLWTPRGVSSGAAKKAPMIMTAHGGPPVHTRFRWDAAHQWLAAQGYGILDFDYRGSSGYGRTFRRAGYNNWGSADIEDALDATEWACTQLPWVDRENLAIRGASYGGYMVMLALTQHPTLFRCGLNSCGVTDVYELSRTCNQSELIATILQMGDPEANREAYRRASPVFKVENIQAPLLIHHGRSDITVTLAQSEMLVQQMKIHGKYVDVKYYDGEGHGLNSRPEVCVDRLQRETAFLKAHMA